MAWHGSIFLEVKSPAGETRHRKRTVAIRAITGRFNNGFPFHSLGISITAPYRN